MEGRGRGGGSNQCKFERTADFRDGQTGFINMQRNARPAEPVEYLWNFIVRTVRSFLLLLVPRADVRTFAVRYSACLSFSRAARASETWWKELGRGNVDENCCETIVNRGWCDV